MDFSNYADVPVSLWEGGANIKAFPWTFSLDQIQVISAIMNKVTSVNFS